MRFSRKISENRKIEDNTADDLNILICHLPEKKDGSVYEPTALASFACCLHSRKKNKNVVHQPRSVIIGTNRETVPVVFSNQNHRHSFFQYGPPSLWIMYTVYSRPNLNEILFTLGQEWLLNVKKRKHLCKANKTNNWSGENYSCCHCRHCSQIRRGREYVEWGWQGWAWLVWPCSWKGQTIKSICSVVFSIAS